MGSISVKASAITSLEKEDMVEIKGTMEKSNSSNIDESTNVLTPTEAIAELLDAMDKNDAQRIRSAFSADASQLYERWYARKKRGEKFRSWLETDIIDVHGRVIDPEITVHANQVTVKGTYMNDDNYTNKADFLFVVEKGKVVSWTMRY